MNKTLVLLILCSFHNSFPQWTTDVNENTPFSWYTQAPIAVTDSENGLILISQTHQQYGLIFAQRISVNGERLWPGEDGVRISDVNHRCFLVHNNDYAFEFALPDGHGGCFIPFIQEKFLRFTEGGEMEICNYTLYLQHLNANGERLWGSDGLMLMPETPDTLNYQQVMSYWYPDGNGGLYITWYRWHYTDTGNNGTYMAHLDEKGEFIWGPKKIYPSYLSTIPFLDINSNLNTYCYIGEPLSHKTQNDYIRYSFQTGEEIFKKTIEIGTGEWGFNAFYDYCPSENNSAIFVFRDFRADTLRMQKIDANGDKLWGENPIFIGTGLYRSISFKVESDRQGGAFVLYRTIADTFHVVHYGENGSKLWTYSFYSKTDWVKGYCEMMSVGSDGSVFIIKDVIKTLTKLNFNGDLLWETTVSKRDTLNRRFYNFGLLADEIGGCINYWYEQGNNFIGIRGQRVNADGTLGFTTKIIQKKTMNEQKGSLNVFPNPSNSVVKILTEPGKGYFSLKRVIFKCCG